MKNVLTILFLIIELANAQIIIDHNSISEFGSIGVGTLNGIRNNIKIYYAHRSHGQQLVPYGAQSVLDNYGSNYNFKSSWGLPNDNTALCISDQACWHPYEYCTGSNGMSQTITLLDANPSINLSFFMWCSDLDTLSESEMQEYLNNMEQLSQMYSESGSKHRKVTFVYFTSNMEANQWDATLTYNKYLRNQQIRAWVKDNPSKNRILFDFADIDSHRYNSSTASWDKNSMTYNGVTFDVEIGDYNYQSGNGHTIPENIANKGKAFWVMLSKIYNNEVLPIELTNFSVKQVDEDFLIEWATATEINNSHFDIQTRSIDSDWKTIATIQGNGNSNSYKTYSFRFNAKEIGNEFIIRLKQVDNNGNYKYYSEKLVKLSYASCLKLEQNYPNPFNPSTKISFYIPKKAFTTLKIYDITGKLIETLIDKEVETGSYTVNFNASGLSSGIYFYRLESDCFSKTCKMILTK